MKRFMKKITLGLLTVAVLTGALTACQKASDNNSNTAKEPTPAATNAAAEPTKAPDAEPTEAPAAEAIKVYAATGGSPKPFTYVDDSDELTGHNIELIKAVFDKLPQYELILEKTDFPSIFAGLDSDRYQIGVNNFAMNEQRKEKYLFSDPIFENRYVAIVASDNDSLDSVATLSDLAGLDFVGSPAINSTTAVENYNTANPDKLIKINYTEEDLVLQLQDIESGKYDFLLIDKPMYEYYNREYNFNLKELEVSNEVSSNLMSEPYSYLLISKGNDQLQEDINKALQEVIADGTSKEINVKYFGEDYTPYTR